MALGAGGCCLPEPGINDDSQFTISSWLIKIAGSCLEHFITQQTLLPPRCSRDAPTAGSAAPSWAQPIPRDEQKKALPFLGRGQGPILGRGQGLLRSHL